MSTATKIKDLDDFSGTAALYRLDPPLVIRDWDDNEEGTTEYVAVSATVVPYSGPETYIFAADEFGYVTGWGELDGSYRGGLSHEAALTGAGYETVR